MGKYTEKALRQHPGANPNRGINGRCGYFWGRKKKRDGSFSTLTVIDASRWIPHQSEREMSRAARRTERKKWKK